MRYYFELYHFLPSSSIYLALFSFLFLIVFLYFKNRLNAWWGYLFIFIAVVFIGFSFSFIDPFIHPWDEQFHALVAKHMISNPFHPILLEKTACTDYKNWLSNSTWLHKQPLFMWQMAISMKCFGANFLAVRIPSILLHAFTTLFVFSIARRMLKEFLATIVVVLYGFSGSQ